MVHAKVSTRYARSLYGLAKEQGSVDLVLADMMLFSNTLASHKGLAKMVSSPVIPGPKKKAVLDKLFKPHFQKITAAFFDLVLAKGREKDLPGISNAFLHEDKLQKGISEGKLVTAVAIPDEIRKSLWAKAEEIAGGKVFLEEKVNPELIGGFLLQVNDLQLDATVSSKLTKIRDKVIDHSYIPKIHIPK